MPNNTANKLQFLCFDDADERFAQIIKSFKSDDRALDFQKIIPLEHGKDPRDVWGTKWNAYDTNIVKSRMSLTFFFETAWDWPKPIINKVLELYPDMHISFNAACEGGWFAVSMTRYEGEKVELYTWDSDSGNDADGKIRAAMHSALTI